MSPLEFQKLLSKAVPLTPEGADLVLDLRQTLLEKGHPGTCVQCFFSLLGSLQRPGALNPLKHWLESHLVVAVRIDGKIREHFPVRIGNTRSLEDYCQKTAQIIRTDRAYKEEQIFLSFQYCQK